MDKDRKQDREREQNGSREQDKSAEYIRSRERDKNRKQNKGNEQGRGRNTKDRLQKHTQDEAEESGREEEQGESLQQHEDVALKAGMRFFADELLPYLGIKGKVVGYAPTELVHLEIKKFFQDFNLEMDDGLWKHFKFQSTNEGAEGLRRFHAYEALTEYLYKVPVTTYVLYLGTIQNPMTELKQGVNTYKIVPIIMKSKDADKVIQGLKEKLKQGENLTREDLVPLTLCLLMGGTMSQKERVKSAFEITKKAAGADISTEDIRNIEAMVYVMADKFLDQMDMEEIKEEISMTRLGQMLVEAGEERVNKLNNKLIKEGKYKELERATRDKEYQKHLFAEYGIS